MRRTGTQHGNPPLRDFPLVRRCGTYLYPDNQYPQEVYIHSHKHQGGHLLHRYGEAVAATFVDGDTGCDDVQQECAGRYRYGEGMLVQRLLAEQSGRDAQYVALGGLDEQEDALRPLRLHRCLHRRRCGEDAPGRGRDGAGGKLSVQERHRHPAAAQRRPLSVDAAQRV